MDDEVGFSENLSVSINPLFCFGEHHTTAGSKFELADHDTMKLLWDLHRHRNENIVVKSLCRKLAPIFRI